jgi:hypothetical protein
MFRAPQRPASMDYVPARVPCVGQFLVEWFYPLCHDAGREAVSAELEPLVA